MRRQARRRRASFRCDSVNRWSFGNDLANRVVEFLGGPGLARGPIGEYRADSLEEADIVADAQGFFVRHATSDRVGGVGITIPPRTLLPRADEVIQRWTWRDLPPAVGTIRRSLCGKNARCLHFRRINP